MSTIRRISYKEGDAQDIAKELKSVLALHRFLLDRDAAELMAIACDVMEPRLPDDVLEQLRRSGRGKDAEIIVVDGLSTADDPPPTPIRGYCDDTVVALVDALLLGLFGVLRINPVAYSYENFGHLPRNVVPNPDAAGVKSSHGYDAELGWHSDNPCGPFEFERRPSIASDRSPIPHFLGFSCLRNSDRNCRSVPTELLIVKDVLAKIDKRALAVLTEPEFSINPPASNNCPPLKNVPLVVARDGEVLLRFNTNSGQVFGESDKATWAIDELKSAMLAAEGDAVKVELQPGMLLIFDNYRVSHRRRCFDPGDNWAKARWLRRMFGCCSLLSGTFVDRHHWPHLWK